jgi:hypothetical protein
MAFTIDFDNEFRFGTIEVDDVGFDCVLPSEFSAPTLAVGEDRPKNPFGLRRHFSKLLGTRSDSTRYGWKPAIGHKWRSVLPRGRQLLKTA